MLFLIFKVLGCMLSTYVSNNVLSQRWPKKDEVPIAYHFRINYGQLFTGSGNAATSFDAVM